MNSVLILSENPKLTQLWASALSNHYQVSTTSVVNDHIGADAVIIDTHKFDQTPSLLAQFGHKQVRILIVGADWPEDRQINALVQGAAGYCCESEPPKLLLRAIESILKGDIWIQRHLVPKVIGKLVQIKAPPAKETSSAAATEAQEKLKSLSKREFDVARMIRDGENNKRIASAMEISERTVKAHLTSVFKKLNLKDRLHLALFIKEFD